MNFEKKYFYYYWLVVLYSVSLWSSSPFVAHVDKTTVPVGESFTLTLKYHGESKNPPDFSPLEKDFSILSRQVSSSKSIINGNYTAETSWILQLMPREQSKKSLSIPSITLDSYKTDPINITQSEEAQKPSSSGRNYIDLKVTADRTSAYVNSEIVVTISIKTPLVLQNGTLNKLEIPNAIVEPLVEDTLEQVVENGIMYNVFRRSYAVFPSKPGELIIPAFNFSGQVANARNAQRGFGFFHPRDEVRASSKEVKVAIKDIPETFPKGHPFLPVKSFVVIESFDDASPDFEVNKATARRFEMKAKGTLPAFLPTVALPSVKNLQIYSEAGQKNKNTFDDGIEANMKFSHVYMPTAGGKITVPEQTIYWWDTEADELRTTPIRALELDVKGEGAVIPSLVPSEAPLQPPQASPPEDPTSQLEIAPRNVWIFVALGLLLLWVATISLWYVARKRRQRLPKTFDSKEAELKDLSRSVLTACDVNDAKHVYERLQVLRSWLIKEGRKDVFDATLLDDMNRLEQTLYTSRKGDDALDTMAAIKKHTKMLKFGNDEQHRLKPLYPN